jgi:Na+-transporting NADH:ubiquinone oxidoreductase subunit NqrD
MLVSSIVIEIKILLIDQLLEHFMCQPVDASMALFTEFACGFCVCLQKLDALCSYVEPANTFLFQTCYNHVFI